jgi:hypothetical protein
MKRLYLNHLDNIIVLLQCHLKQSHSADSLEAKVILSKVFNVGSHSYQFLNGAISNGKILVFNQNLQ